MPKLKQRKILKRNVKMETTKKNAVASVKKEIETKLETAREENGLAEGEKNIVTEEDQAQATVAGAEKAVREQLDVMEAEDETKTGDESTATGATGNAEKRAEQVTSSIADEAVASVLRAEKNATLEEEEIENNNLATPAERVDAAEENVDQVTEEQVEEEKIFEEKRVARQQPVDEAEARVEEEKKTKKLVEKNNAVEQKTEEQDLDSSIDQVDAASPIENSRR